AAFLVADSKFMKVAFGVGFKMIVVPSSGTTSRYVVPTGRVKVPADRYVVPTGLKIYLGLDLQNSSGSTTILSDYSLPDYEVFNLDDDHIKEKSSGSTTTYANFSLPKYDSFIFDLLINLFPPADGSDFYHEEFAGDFAHIISSPEYDCFYFKSELDLGELTSIVDSGIRENVLPITNVNLPFEDDQSPLLAYVVWIFLPFLTYPVTPPYLLSYGNEDTIFDPGISIYHSFMPGVSHRSGTFMKFIVYPNHLNESPIEIFYLPLAPPRPMNLGIESGSRLGE
ncbi:hypothetical protein Tco_1046128, partial [Tanacetum coccineum]